MVTVNVADVEHVGQAIDVRYHALLTRTIAIQQALEAKQRKLSDLHRNLLTVRQARSEVTKRAGTLSLSSPAVARHYPRKLTETSMTRRSQLSTALEEAQNRTVVLKEDLSRRKYQKRQLGQEVRVANGRLERFDTTKRAILDQLSAAQKRIANESSNVQAIRRQVRGRITLVRRSPDV